MLNCTITRGNGDSRTFSVKEPDLTESFSIGGDQRCEFLLPPEWNPPPVLLTLSRLEQELIAVPGGDFPLEIDERAATVCRISSGTMVRCGDFTVLFSGELEESDKVLMWRIGKEPVQYEDLGYGANLIGSGGECRCVIASPAIPNVLFRCWIDQSDNVLLDPMQNENQAKFRGKPVNTSLTLATGEIFTLAPGIRAAVITRDSLADRRKRQDPFHPKLTFWQMITLASVALFVGALCFYEITGKTAPPGREYQSLNSIPRFNPKTPELFERQLADTWMPLLKEGKLRAVQADIEFILAKETLPPHVKRKLQNFKQEIELDRHGLRTVRYYKSKFKSWSLKPVTQYRRYHLLEDWEAVKRSESNLFLFWTAAKKNLKDAIDRRTAIGNIQRSPFLEDGKELLNRVDRLLHFYDTLIKIYQARSAGDYLAMARLVKESAFLRQIRNYADWKDFLTYIAFSDLLTRLENEMAGRDFQPSALPEFTKKMQILNDMDASAQNIMEKSGEKNISRRVADLRRIYNDFAALVRKERTLTPDSPARELLNLRLRAWRLSLSPALKENRYLRQLNSRLSAWILQRLATHSGSIAERGDLLKNERFIRRGQLENEDELNRLEAKLESESAKMLAASYQNWLNAPKNKKNEWLQKMRADSLPDSATRAWIEEQQNKPDVQQTNHGL